MMGTLSREVQLELRCEHLEEIELPLPPSYQEAMSQTIFTIDDFCASRDTQNASTLSNENARDMQAATTDHEGQNSSLAVEVETSDHANRRTLETVKAVALIFIFLLSATFIYMDGTLDDRNCSSE
ncbi:uncharacterized protein LOC135685366 isoform X3 [Rhopilema esculentum]|uniref:uncharacterized protein LOC135685366 isoform X3 n=1 Tax=Rhopilema esculentum TaxID=499914 RepID=UPI0031DF3CB5